MNKMSNFWIFSHHFPSLMVEHRPVHCLEGYSVQRLSVGMVGWVGGGRGDWGSVGMVVLGSGEWKQGCFCKNGPASKIWPVSLRTYLSKHT